MLAVCGIIFGIIWALFWDILRDFSGLTPIFLGFIMMLLTLALTGGLHLDGLMDTCDAVFSHRDRETRLKILSDTHAGSFAVIGCIVVILCKTILFAEFMRTNLNPAIIPVYSRFGMAVLLNNLGFAKNNGLAVTLGVYSTRNWKNNIFFAVFFVVLAWIDIDMTIVFCFVLWMWWRMCVNKFGGITGDLLGGFVEVSECFVMMLWVLKVSV